MLLREAGEIIKIAVLSIRVFGIAVAHTWRRRDQQCDAIRFHLRHQFFAAELHFTVFITHFFLKSLRLNSAHKHIALL